VLIRLAKGHVLRRQDRRWFLLPSAIAFRDRAIVKPDRRLLVAIDLAAERKLIHPGHVHACRRLFEVATGEFDLSFVANAAYDGTYRLGSGFAVVRDFDCFRLERNGELVKSYPTAGDAFVKAMLTLLEQGSEVEGDDLRQLLGLIYVHLLDPVGCPLPEACKPKAQKPTASRDIGVGEGSEGSYAAQGGQTPQRASCEESAGRAEK
jgi:hypothetical protein